jgi:hypothetical protein
MGSSRNHCVERQQSADNQRAHSSKYFADDNFMCHPATFFTEEYNAFSVCGQKRRAETPLRLPGRDLGEWSGATR